MHTQLFAISVPTTYASIERVGWELADYNALAVDKQLASFACIQIVVVNTF